MRITEQDYVDKAEQAIKRLTEKKDNYGRPVPIVTTSKIRNLLAMVSDIYNEVMDLKSDRLNDEIVGRISYMRMRFYYEAGREQSVKELFSASEILDILKEIGTSKKNFILFSRYMESLVAFKRYYVKNDD